jgi:hypothetical protein
MTQKSGQYVYMDDGTVALQVQIAGTSTSSSNGGDLPVSSNSLLPIDIQSRLASTIQTHNAVSVGQSGSSASSWYSADGFDKIVLNYKNDASTSSSIQIQWSPDNGTSNVSTSTFNGSSTNNAPSVVDVSLPYFRIVLYNNDAAAAHTMSAWVLLKA